MKIQVKQESLNKAIQIVIRSVSARSTLPILRNILLVADGNQLRLVGYNRESAMSCRIAAVVTEEGQITVPAELLSRYVAALPAANVSVVLREKDMSVAFECDGGKARMSGIDAYDFPIIPTIAEIDSPITEVEASDLREAFSLTAFAAHKDGSAQPMLANVEMSSANGKVKLATTDGARASVRHISTLSGDGFLSLLIPSSNALELLRVAADAKGVAQIAVSENRNQVVFRFDGSGLIEEIEMVSEISSYNYPDITSLIRHQHTITAQVDSVALQNAARLAKLFSGETNFAVMTIDPGGELRLRSMASGVGNSVNRVEAVVEGSEMEVQMNMQFVIDILQRISDPTVTLCFSNAKTPVVIRGAGMDATMFSHVVMPVNIAGATEVAEDVDSDDLDEAEGEE